MAAILAPLLAGCIALTPAGAATLVPAADQGPVNWGRILYSLPPEEKDKFIQAGLDFHHPPAYSALRETLESDPLPPSRPPDMMSISAELARRADAILERFERTGDPAGVGGLFLVQALLGEETRARLARDSRMIPRATSKMTGARSLEQAKTWVRERFLSTQDPAEKSRLAERLAGSGFSNPLDLAVWLHPEYGVEIRDFYPGLGKAAVINPKQLEESIFAHPDWMRGWAENVRRMKVAAPEVYRKAIGRAEGRDLDRASFFAPLPGRPKGYERDGYLLPYPLDENSRSVQGAEPEVVELAQKLSGALERQGLLRHYSLFQKFIEANFQALESMASKAWSPSRSDAEEPAGARPSLLRLEDVDGSARWLVGGKSAKLGEMLSALKGQDALVPGGIALTFLAYEKFLEENGLRGLIAGLAAEIDASGDVDRISAEIRKAIFSGRLQPGKGVGKEILEALQAGDGSRWAVRSSAVQEDGDDAAFAGAAESFLFVKPEEILAKVVENWASFWLPRGIRYRMGRGLRGADIRPATLIQEMSPADASGVIFTRDPVSSADEIVINASYGLGEGVVSGAAASDSYTVLKDGTEAELPHIARKRWMIVEDPGPKGTRLAPVPTALRGRRVLTREQTRRLALIAAALERRFGRPMDIEFSIDRGRIVILQARPITSLRAL